MLDFLNRFSLPVRGAIIGFAAGLLGVLIAALIGLHLEYPWAGVAGVTLGGLIGGWIRQRRRGTS